MLVQHVLAHACHVLPPWHNRTVTDSGPRHALPADNSPDNDSPTRASSGDNLAHPTPSGTPVVRHDTSRRGEHAATVAPVAVNHRGQVATQASTPRGTVSSASSSSASSSAPSPSSPSSETLPPVSDEAGRRRELKKYKAIATGLLVFATVIYLVCRWLEQDSDAAWIGYVRAASEAGMVGALADWFAVTALFRRPMHLPIPHTAIIRRKKDQVGEALSGFVGDNFLNAELITDKVQKADIPARVGQWASEPANAARVSEEVGNATIAIVEGIDDDEAAEMIRTMVIDRIAEPDWGPPAGALMEQFIAEGKAEPVVDTIISWAYDRARTSEELITRLLNQRAPSWAPGFINDLVGERVYREVVDFAYKVKTEPDHEARQALRRVVNQWASDLQHDPKMISRVEEFKHDVLSSAPVQAAPGTVWRNMKEQIVRMASDPQSHVRRRIAEEVSLYANRLLTDPELRARWGERVTGTARYIAQNFSGEVTSIISETVERWDADEASDKIELMVGKDLQYIRFNGTIVGSLAGLLIYTLSQLVLSL
ncbi:DUF445 domain-containing protein [Corynebacterium parakroppenstedtii]|uniref:DUF445 domain-containing protein n=1 Tax=Corynebacterium parakroppenstedtii TaxID=2828363 RepID=UPI0021AEC3B8